MVAFRCHISAIVLLATAICCCGQAAKNYTGFTVYRCIPQSDDHIIQLKSLQSKQTDTDLDFWTEPSVVNRAVDVMVAPKGQDIFTNSLRSSEIPFEKLIEDVGHNVERTKDHSSHLRSYETSNSSSQQSSTWGFYKSYPTFEKIEAKLNSLAKNDQIKLVAIGKSSEKRNLYLVKVSSGQEANKPIILIDAGHHAREWLSHITAIYFIESLISDRMPRQKNYTSNTLKPLLDQYEFWFLPVVNPDGYVYSHRKDRMWRKTRSRNGNSQCFGVDPNRNYDVGWSVLGGPCSPVYAGTGPNSEPEVKAVAKTLCGNGERIKLYVTLHSHAQALIYPFSYIAKVPKNVDELDRIGKSGAEAIASLRGTEYDVSPAHKYFGITPGGSDDFALAKCKIRFVYTIELPDRGRFGFLMPPSYIIPTAQETMLGIAAMVKELPN